MDPDAEDMAVLRRRVRTSTRNIVGGGVQASSDDIADTATGSNPGSSAGGVDDARVVMDGLVR